MSQSLLFINGKFLAQATTGVQRYAAEIVRAWDKGFEQGWIDSNRFKIIIVTPRDLVHPAEYSHIEVVRGSTNGRIWEQVELPWIARGSLLFSPYAAAPILKFRHSVTIHDAGLLATPDQYSAAFRLFYGLVYRILGKTCVPIFTVSEFSKNELERLFGIAGDKIKVCPPGCDYLLSLPADNSILERNGLRKGEYILGVSSRSPIKNFARLARAWTLLGRNDMKLAIAGGGNSRVFGKQVVSDDVNLLWLGYVADRELRALYENAAMFVYPSLYEGFGLPPIEAMGCGCPVIVANSSALPESCATGALYCDPENVGDIADKIAKLLADPALVDDLRDRGRERFRQLTIRDAAERLWLELSPYV